MRFLFDAHHLGRNQTGNETWVRNVLLAIRDLKGEDEFEYGVGTRGLEVVQGIAAGRIHVLRDNSLVRLGVDLPRIARETQADAVLATYTAPLTRRPVVLAVHDVSSWHAAAQDWLPLRTRLQYRASVGFSARRAAHVLALSRTAKRDLIEKVGLDPEGISVAPPAVDPELEALLRRTPRTTGTDKFRVLAVGNVLPRKNLVVLAQAVSECRGEGIAIELRIVGSIPPREERVAAEIRRLLGPDVEMVGYVTQAQLAAEYKSADVLGFPSLLEGFGIPVIEAMAAGVPVVVSDASALPEAAGGAALVRGARDAAGWHDALKRLHDDDGLREHLRQRGFQRAAQLSWRNTAATVLHQLRAAAGAAPAR